MKKLNITFCSFPDYSGNAKALYEYMKNRYKNNMNYTWIVYNEETIKLLEESSIKSILIGSDEFKKYIKKTDVFFTTHANLTGDKIIAKNSIYVELWHGIGPKPIGFLTNNLSAKDIDWYNSLGDEIDYFIVPSEFWRSMFSAMFNMNATRIKPLGLPLLDEVKYSDGIKNLNTILNIDVSKYNKIIMYMPTFKKGCGRDLESKYNEQNILNIDSYSDDELVEFLRENNYLLLVKRHPSDVCIYKVIENDYIKNINNDMLIKNRLNVNNILNAANLLITDYSSTGLEFSFLDRPVIYLSNDLNEYKKNRGILLDNYDFWTDNIYCNNFIDLIKKIKLLIGKKKVIKNKNLIYGNLNDGGCDKICDFVFDDYNISSNVVRHDNKVSKMKKKIEKLNNIVNEQVRTIKKLTESEIRLKEIENSKTWMFLEKIRKIKK